MTPAELPTFGRYRTVEVLGSGAMGVVYKAHDPGIDRFVALKIIKQELLDGAQGATSIARFRNEAMTAGRLSHPGIVTVYELGEDHGTTFIAMEFAPGLSLADYVIARGGLSLDELRILMGQLLEALHYAHGHGVIHRDIKPANLLVSSEGRLKITDFGIARLQTGRLTRTGNASSYLAGTPFYMAPELYQGGEADHRVDLFACGVVLYEILVGETPFLAETIEAVAYRICHAEPVPPTQRNANVPAEFDPIVARALAKRKEDRFATAREFAQALGMGPNPLTATGGIAGPPSVPPPTPASTGPGLAAPPALATTAPSQMAWTPVLLKALEDALTPAIGPIAKVMVKRAAAQARTFDALCSRLSGALATELERTSFLKKAEAVRPAK